MRLNRQRTGRAGEAGFSLTEVIMASAVLVTGLVAVAQLFAVSTNANRVARRTSMATILAQQKIEQLRGLTWGFDAFGLPISDFQTNLTVWPPSQAGGSGLSPSPAGSLDTNAVGCVDYLGPYGNWIGTGSTPPDGTVYVRRWNVAALPTNPNNTLVFQVRVSRIQGQPSASGAAPGDDVRIVSVKTRKAN
jgi:type II secretory pathway pseudopilin PulG